MAAPVDSARQGTNISTAGTSHAINVGSPVAGTLLIVFVRTTVAPGTVTFTGYTLIAGPDTSDAADDETRVYARIADGTEGTTDTLTTANPTKLSAIAYEITGASSVLTDITVSTVAVGTTTANTANPSSVVPKNAPQDTLYLALAGGDGEAAYTGTPTNYSNLGTANSGITGSAAGNNFMGSASRALTASSSEDPGAFTHGAHTTGWTAFAVAIVGPQAVTETPTPGGAVAGGPAPAARVTETLAGAVASGVAFVPNAPAAIQGAIASGPAPTARASLTIAGATAGGFPPPFAGVVDPVTIGGASAGGASPIAASSSSIAGAIASGAAPTTSTALTIAGSLASGLSPAPGSSTTIAGAVGGSFAPTSSSTFTIAGATAGGPSPTASSTTTIDGALAGGYEPTEDIAGAGVTQTPDPGGALADGFAPTAIATSTTGGALADGVPVSALVSTTIVGATAGGFGPAIPGADFPAPGGATAGGFSPAAQATSSTGGALAGGLEAGALVLVSPGGAIADGFTILIAQGVYADPETGRIEQLTSGSISSAGDGRLELPITGRTVL